MKSAERVGHGPLTHCTIVFCGPLANSRLATAASAAGEAGAPDALLGFAAASGAGALAAATNSQVQWASSTAAQRTPGATRSM
ncbi:hypothetical protein OV079_35060 [Nannocystis pusilla]|uniref:Uncharacterized protein n=1 Tax=Nannocystis pusilla TaxID=889268 RepID=A0A9X3F3A4_9BACT|nr:hypothetical protein [Nannocystis pusilla]MCY1010698.1 hypothetical protein [Nannocystis pusilla]